MSYLDIARNRVMIDIACNDPDNGMFSHRAMQIQIGSEFMELEAQNWSTPPRFVELGNKVRLSGKLWPIHGSKEWIGNWCWNGYWFDIPTAVDFLVWLHGRRLFHCAMGEERIYNLWNGDAPLDRARDFLDRMLGKPSTFATHPSAPAAPQEKT